LFVVGIIGIWLLLLLLGHLGVFSIQPGLVGDASIANRVNEVMAYTACAAAIGIAMVMMPRQLHRAVSFQAAAIVQGKKDELDRADDLFRQALASYEETCQ